MFNQSYTPVMSTMPLCTFDLPDHFAEYQLTDEEAEDPIGSCSAHLSDTINWRLATNKAVLLTRAEPIEEETPEPKAERTEKKAEREPEHAAAKK